MIRKRSIFFLLLWLTIGLSACVYDKEIQRRETLGARLDSPEPERYGRLRLLWVREYREPWWIFKFPDGGKPYELALYAVVYQSGNGIAEREIGRIQLEPVRRGDFGNFYDGSYDWVGPARLSWWVDYGYAGNRRRADGTLSVPPLR